MKNAPRLPYIFSGAATGSAWSVNPLSGRIVAPVARFNGGGASIASTDSWAVGTDEARANASLIAAAPALFLLLEDITTATTEADSRRAYNEAEAFLQALRPSLMLQQFPRG